jgi:hypothetical protein
MPLRQTDRRTNDELEDWGWEQQPATREEHYPYRVSSLVQRSASAAAESGSDGEAYAVGSQLHTVVRHFPTSKRGLFSRAYLVSLSNLM